MLECLQKDSDGSRIHRMSGEPEDSPDDIEITPEMMEAGIRAAWPEPMAPQIVEDQVRKIYTAIEFVRLGACGKGVH